jgi:hypothetical protein
MRFQVLHTQWVTLPYVGAEMRSPILLTEDAGNAPSLPHATNSEGRQHNERESEMSNPKLPDSCVFGRCIRTYEEAPMIVKAKDQRFGVERTFEGIADREGARCSVRTWAHVGARAGRLGRRRVDSRRVAATRRRRSRSRPGIGERLSAADE